MRRVLINMFWIGFIGCSITQCNFCGNYCDIRHEFTPEFKRYFLDFGAGSYWIFKDTINNRIDTLKLIENNAQYQGNKLECFSDTRAMSYTMTPRIDLFIGFSADSPKHFSGSYNFYTTEIDFDKTVYMEIIGKTYKVIALNNCCLNFSCPDNESKYIFRCGTARGIAPSKMYFSPAIGLVKWETEDHPVYGKASYALIKSNIIPYERY